jgi:hypothetical protein
MVDALFCLIYAPKVEILSNSSKLFYEKIVCDGGEITINLTHVLTNQDLDLL